MAHAQRLCTRGVLEKPRAASQNRRFRRLECKNLSDVQRRAAWTRCCFHLSRQRLLHGRICGGFSSKDLRGGAVERATSAVGRRLADTPGIQWGVSVGVADDGPNRGGLLAGFLTAPRSIRISRYTLALQCKPG